MIEIASKINKLSTNKRAAIKGGSMVMGSVYSAALTDGAFDLRGALPEPFDYPQHAGNVFAGAVIGTTVGNLVAALHNRFGEDQGERSHRRIRAIAAASATIVGITVNAAFETRTGISLLHMSSYAGTPDMVDFAYGVGSSAMAGGAAPTFDTGTEQRHLLATHKKVTSK